MKMVISCADLCDRFGDSLSYLESNQFRHFGGTRIFAGPIRTVKCSDDNSRVKEILASPGNGAVLIVDNSASLRRAVVGDLIAQSASDNGWSGIVVNGCIRDSAAVGQMPIGIYAVGTTPRKTERKGAGEKDLPVEFSGVRFIPGHWVYVGSDGLIVSETEIQ